MIKTTSIVIILILAVLLVYLFPKQAINPGDLSKGHQHLENNCMQCHTIFLGTPGEKCIFCHKPAEIGKFTTSGVKIEAKPGQAKAAFHQLFTKDSCLSCHMDHSGQDVNKTIRKFSHNLLQRENFNQCTTCHQRSADNVHQKNDQECSQCHTTDRWRPATLDHAQYFLFDKDHGPDCVSCHQRNNYKEYTCYGCHEHTPEKIQQEHEKVGIYSYQNCLICHPGGDKEESKRILKSIKGRHASGINSADIDYMPSEGYKKSSHNLLRGQNINDCISCHKVPADSLHRGGDQNCAHCHTANHWRPTTLDHSRYFRFDKHHGPDCLACHQKNNYKEYTCYGCHEHTPGKIRKEHLEEGISNYQNCAPCHPSADEDEAKRIFRSGAYQDRSWNRLEKDDYNQQKGYLNSGYNDYEEDDDDSDDDDEKRGKHHDD